MSESVSDEAITQTVIRCWEGNQYLLCPHSAVAMSHHYQQMDLQQPRYNSQETLTVRGLKQRRQEC